MTQTPVSQASVERLRSGFGGRLLMPEDEGYDAARTVWNALIDRRPALIAQCRDADDVIAAVQFGREHDILVSIRGGGHGVAGNAVADGGLMIDLSPMKGITIDREGRIARVAGGVLWEELDAATQEHGLATVGGVVPSTGVAGLTLGGGMGWLSGKHGLSVDNLVSTDVVLADGSRVRASDDENRDLFWAIRGAGHNFGVVTSFDFRLHHVGPVVIGGMVVHPLPRATEVLDFYREFAPIQPDELTTYAGILTTPDGHPAVGLAVCYAGDLAEGERVLAPLRAFGPPVMDMVGPMPYTAVQGMFGPAFPPGRLNYWKSGMTRSIEDPVIDALADFGARRPSPFNVITFQACFGANLRVEDTATAYSHREEPFDLVILASWTDPADTDANIGWARDLYAAVSPHLTGGVYVNDLGGDVDEQRVRAAYGPNHARLAELKAKYDPTNFFRLNQNIRPADANS